MSNKPEVDVLAPGQIQLAKDMRDVDLNCSPGQNKAGRDVFVRQPKLHEPRELPLTGT